MRSALVLTYVIVLLCVIESICLNINEFFSQGLSDLGSALHTAWVKISTALKKPVRIRRTRQGGKKKRTTVTTPMTPPPNMSTIAIYLFSRGPRPALVKPTIPVFTMPPFKSAVEWRKQQIPYLLNPVKGSEDNSNITPFEILDASPEEQSKQYSNQE